MITEKASTDINAVVLMLMAARSHLTRPYAQRVLIAGVLLGGLCSLHARKIPPYRSLVNTQYPPVADRAVAGVSARQRPANPTRRRYRPSSTFWETQGRKLRSALRGGKRIACRSAGVRSWSGRILPDPLAFPNVCLFPKWVPTASISSESPTCCYRLTHSNPYALHVAQIGPP